jgi:hypothetical protein
VADLTCSQLAALWISAGGSPSVANLMASIAMAESSGNPGALNLTDNNGTQTSVGLWQVSNGTHQYPASWLTEAGNAAEAVAKYASQGLSAWGTYDSGAYKNYCGGGGGQTGSTTGSGAGAGSGGGGGGGGGADDGTPISLLTSDIQPITPTDSIQTASFLGNVFSNILDPFNELFGAEFDIAKALAPVTVDFLQTFKALTTFIGAALGGLKTIIEALDWLFNPSHWIRIFCFLFGLLVAVPAMYALMHTGTGDMYLAVGIALTTIAGALFFLAFHNLPYEPPSGGVKPPASVNNVISFQALLAYVSQGIRQAASPGTGVSLDAYYLSNQGSTGTAPASSTANLLSALGFGSFTGLSATGYTPYGG